MILSRIVGPSFTIFTYIIYIVHTEFLADLSKNMTYDLD